MEVEDQVQLTDVAEILIEYFHKCMNHFKYDELIFVLVHNRDKVKRGVSFVHNLILLVFDEIAGFGFTSDDELVYLNCGKSTSLRNLCFYCWLMLCEYHFVRRDRPCLLIRKKQWIIEFKSLKSIVNLKLCKHAILIQSIINHVYKSNQNYFPFSPKIHVKFSILLKNKKKLCNNLRLNDEKRFEVDDDAKLRKI